MQTILRLVKSTTPPPRVFISAGSHPGTLNDQIVLGGMSALCERPAQFAAVLAQLRRDLDAIEAEARKHFG